MKLSTILMKKSSSITWCKTESNKGLYQAEKACATCAERVADSGQLLCGPGAGRTRTLGETRRFLLAPKEWHEVGIQSSTTGFAGQRILWER